MSHSLKRERELFVGHVVRSLPNHSVHVAVDLARELMRLAGIVDRYAVNLCNGETTEREKQRAERTAKKMGELIYPFGWPVTIGGDPRGYVVKIKFPSGAYNTWGGSQEGYGVPTA